MVERVREVMRTRRIRGNACMRGYGRRRCGKRKAQSAKREAGRGKRKAGSGKGGGSS
jgi:hypothetical protein